MIGLWARQADLFVCAFVCLFVIVLVDLGQSVPQ